MFNALIITGDKVQDHEFIYPYYRLLEEEYNVDVAVRDNKTVYGYYGTRIEPTSDIPIPSELDFHPYDVVILPGGAKAMEYMRQDQGILDYIREFYNRGMVIGSICHGAQLLISAGLVKNRMISGYYSIKDDIINAGGGWSDDPVVTDERIVTSPHYKYLGQWMKQVLEVVRWNKESR